MWRRAPSRPVLVGFPKHVKMQNASEVVVTCKLVDYRKWAFCIDEDVNVPPLIRTDRSLLRRDVLAITRWPRNTEQRNVPRCRTVKIERLSTPRPCIALSGGEQRAVERVKHAWTCTIHRLSDGKADSQITAVVRSAKHSGRLFLFYRRDSIAWSCKLGCVMYPRIRTVMGKLVHSLAFKYHPGITVNTTSLPQAVGFSVLEATIPTRAIGGHSGQGAGPRT